MPSTPHPAQEYLVAFAQGKMSMVKLEEVAAHLDECSLCAETVAGVPDDRLVAELRDMTMSIATKSMKHELPPAGEHSDFEILDELGHGGMGVVYLARQRSLHRLVALKIIRSADANRLELARFQTEAEAAARLQHPNIVQLYQTGKWDNQPYIVMEYLKGGHLSKRLREAPLSPKHAAQISKTLARAMHYAHEKNIIHRDLKPSNVLLTEDGEPKISDFGLVKRVDADVGQTRTGDVLGTPSYMPPEQALGKTDQMSPKSDVYSLGATLYEMITGRVPFMADNQFETLKQVVHSEPVPPSRLQPNVPPDLDTICLKCLEKEPNKRYASAEALADDLGRFLRGEPTLARPIGRAARLWRWCRRNPAVASLAALAASILVLATLVSVSLAAWAIYQRDQAEKNAVDLAEQTKVAKSKSEEAKTQAKRADAKAALAAEKAKLAEEQTKIAQKQTKQAHLAQQAAAEERRNSEIAKRIAEAANVVSQNRLFTMSVDKGLELQNQGHLFKSLPYFTSALKILDSMANVDPHRVAIHRRRIGATLALCPQLTAVWRKHRGPVQTIAFSPDGRFILTASLDGSAILYDVQSRRIVRRYVHPAPVTCAAFSHDGSLLATGCDDRRVYVFKPISGQQVVAPLNLQKGVHHVEFSPVNSSYVLAAGGERYGTMQMQRIGNTMIPRVPRGYAKVWNVRTGQLISSVGQNGWINHAVFSRDGHMAATAGGRASNARELVVWDLPLLEEMLPPICMLFGSSRFPPIHALPFLQPLRELRLKHRRLSFQRVAFSPDGGSIAAVSGDVETVNGEAQIWNLKTGEPVMTPLPHGGAARHLEYSPDGRFLVTASDDGIARVWHAETGRAVPRAMIHNDRITTARFSPDSRRVLTSSVDGTVRVWDAATGKPVSPFLMHASPVNCAAFSPDCRQVAIGCANGVVRVWDLAATTAHLLKVNHKAIPNRYVSYAGLTADRRIVTVTALSSRLMASVRGGGSGARMFQSLSNDKAYFWDTEKKQPTAITAHDGPQLNQLLSPDRTHFISYAHGNKDNPSTISIWRAPWNKPLVCELPPDVKISEFVGGMGFISNAHCYAYGVSSNDLVNNRVNDAAKEKHINMHIIDTQTGKLTNTISVRGGWLAHAGLNTQSNRLLAFTVAESPEFLTYMKKNQNDRDYSLLRHEFEWRDGKATNLISKQLVLKDAGAVRYANAGRDGRLIVTVADYWARVWDAQTGTAVTSRLVHSLPIRFAAFSPDGRLVVTVSTDHTARLWDAHTGRAVIPELTHDAEVVHASFSADGEQLVTCCGKGVVRVWDIGSAKQTTAELTDLANLMSDHQLDGTGGLAPLDATALDKLWTKYHQSNPDQFAAAQKRVLAWHEQEADDAQSKSNLFGVGVHRNRLLELKLARWLAGDGDDVDTLHYWESVVADYEQIAALKTVPMQSHLWGAWAYRNLAEKQKKLGDAFGAVESLSKAKKLVEGYSIVLLRKGELKITDKKDPIRKESYHNTVTARLEKGKSYRIDLTSRRFDTFLFVRDPSGNTLAFDDDGGDSYNSRLIFTPSKTADYRIAATSFEPRQTGSYALTIRTATPRRIKLIAKTPKAEPGMQELVVGKAVQGRLTANDAFDKIRRQSRCKVYAVKLQAGGRYRIELTSAEFDTYLRFEDASGRQLAFDDDGGTELNSRLEYVVPKSGEYRVVVTSYEGGRLGAFSLSVRTGP